MADYISRDAVLELVEPDARPFLAERIRNIPAADVVIAKRGKWIDLRHNNIFQCSKCKDRWMGVGGYYYCPNCGAKMDE